jgi:hypothetical protein
MLWVREPHPEKDSRDALGARTASGIEPHPEKYSLDALGAQTSSCVNHRPRLVRGRFLFANKRGAEHELDAACLR